MKLSSLFAATLVLSASLFFAQSYAQSVGIAADKQKQANLEKNKARQAELKKKYNSLTPEQAAEAKRKALEYKKGGYKGKTGQGSNTAPATKPAQPGVSSKNPSQTKTTNTSGSAKTKPVLMDANGKPLNKTTPTATGKPEVSPNKVTAPVKPAVTPSNKAVQKTPVPKTTAVQAKTSTADTKQK